MELSPLGLLFVLSLYPYSGHSEALPTATVYVLPRQGPYYPGDEVTLRCGIAEYTDWNRYYWYRGRGHIPYGPRQTITISLSDHVGQYQYTCEGERGSRPTTSQRSAPVSITLTDLPTATLSVVSPQGLYYPGDEVTLRCDIAEYTDWYRYRWFRGSDDINNGPSQTITISLPDHVGQYQYTCEGERGSRPTTSQHSAPVSITVTALPLATLTVEPHSPVFTGETVTLKCVIKSYSGWTYRMYKWPSSAPVSEGNTFTIRGATESDEGLYWCQGERRDRPTTSQTSTGITLYVTASKPKLTLSTAHHLLRGDSVTLTCELGVSSGLVFYWYRDTQTPDPVAQTDVNSYSIISVQVSDGGQYWCRAGRGDPVYHTQYSDAVQLNIKGPLSISPQRAQHFTYESLLLSCGVQGNSTGWKIRWLSGRGGNAKCPTDWRSEKESTCSTRSASSSDSGVYWCQSASGEQSDPVNITVHDGDVILDSPVSPVTEGDALTLLCRFRNTTSVNTTDFYRDGTLFSTSSTGQMTIPAVSKSHEGLYKCRSPERGESPESWVTVRGLPQPTVSVESHTEQEQSLPQPTVSVKTQSLCLTTAATDQQQQQQQMSTNQSSDQDQSQSAGRGGSESEYMPLQNRSTDVYDTITPLYMPLQRGATDVYETIKSSKDSQEDGEEEYDDVVPSDTRAEEHV